MKCPKCNSESIYVTDTLPSDDGRIYRRKRCSECDLRFNTVELMEVDFNTIWIDALQKVADHSSEEFKRGYYAAYHKKHPKRN